MRPARIGTAGVLVFLLGLCSRAAAQDSTRVTDTVTVRDLPLTAVQRRSFVGSYSVTLPFGEQTHVSIFEENGVLKLQSDQGETRRLLYQGDATFRAEGVPDFVLMFVLERGRATRFTGRKLDGVLRGVRQQ